MWTINQDRKCWKKIKSWGMRKQILSLRHAKHLMSDNQNVLKGCWNATASLNHLSLEKMSVLSRFMTPLSLWHIQRGRMTFRADGEDAEEYKVCVSWVILWLKRICCDLCVTKRRGWSIWLIVLAEKGLRDGRQIFGNVLHLSLINSIILQVRPNNKKWLQICNKCKSPK